MEKWKEGWHPTSRLKYPKERPLIGPLWPIHKSCKRHRYNPVIRSTQKFLTDSWYCWLLEESVDMRCEERRLQEKYERSLSS